MKKLTFIFLLTILLLTGCTTPGNGGGNNDSKFPDPIDSSFVREDIKPDDVGDADDIYIGGGEYSLVWSDEFNYTGAPDSSKWTHEVGTGNGGWGNNESQFYTNRLDNSYVEDGSLKITAKKEAYSGSEYTSARLVSRNKGDFKYGYIEISAKLPGGAGTWPALWMMPTDSVYGGWPNSGEIDIMEYQGKNPNYVFSTIHTKNNHGNGISSGRKHFPNLETTFNKYAMEWTDEYISFYVNDTKIHTVVNPNYSTNNQNAWPFDQRFFVIMNVAMGGTLGGTIDPNFTQSSMYVDYVRVYQKQMTGEDTMEPEMVKGITTMPSSSAISLTWEKADDDYALKQYDIVVNGKQVGATTKTSYIVNGLNPLTNYTIQILAVDLANNYSISRPVYATTTDVLRAPGQLEVEQYIGGKNIFTLNNPSGDLSVDISNVNSEQGYIVCEVEAEAGVYNVTINAMVPRVNSSVYIYVVNSDFEGVKSDAIALTATPGKYNDITTTITLTLTEGINYIMIEGYNATVGKIITIDHIVLSK